MNIADVLSTDATDGDTSIGTCTSDSLNESCHSADKHLPGNAPFTPNANRCHSLLIAIINSRSIKKRFAEFQAFVADEYPDILGTESWLNDSIATSEISPNQYNVIRKDRNGKEGGGVFIAVNEAIPMIERPDLSDDVSEQIIINYIYIALNTMFLSALQKY